MEKHYCKTHGTSETVQVPWTGGWMHTYIQKVDGEIQPKVVSSQEEFICPYCFVDHFIEMSDSKIIEALREYFKES